MRLTQYNSLATKLKDTEYWYLRDREFKIAVMKKLNKLQEKPERIFSELRNKINGIEVILCQRD